MSDKIREVSEQNQILSDILSDEEIPLRYVQRETPLFGKESPISIRNSIDWIEHVWILTPS